MSTQKKIVVCGAGGFIGGHLVADLLRQGETNLRAVDIKPFDEWYQKFDKVENLSLDLGEKEACEKALEGAAHVYNLAADMGGMGFIENNKALCMLTVLINTHLLMAAKKHQDRALFLCVVGLRLRGGQAARSERDGVEGRGRLSGRGGGWLRLGEAFQRADVPPLHGGLQAADARGPFP